MRLILLTLLFGAALTPSMVDPAIQVHTPIQIHYLRTKHLWDAKFGPYHPEELMDFIQGTFDGAQGNERLLPYLSAISCMECGQNEKLSTRKGYLGGRVKTIKKGLKELKIRNAHISRRIRIMALSRRFLVLAQGFGDIQKTCRVWNKGAQWQGKVAARYWKGCRFFVKIYEQ